MKTAPTLPRLWPIWLILILCLLAFAELVRELQVGQAEHVDAFLVGTLNRMPGFAPDLTTPWVREFFRDLTSLGGEIFLVLFVLAVAIYWGLRTNFWAALHIVWPFAIGFLIMVGLKGLFERERPAFDDETIHVSLASFPSGHAMMSMIAFLWLAVLVGRLDPTRRGRAFLIGIALLVTFLVGLSRVYFQVHHPTDVMAGWAAGAAWVAFCCLIDRWWTRRRMHLQTRAPGEA